MDYKAAIEYLRPVADNHPVSGYAAALETAIRAMEEVEALRKERDAAVADISAIIGDIEEIRQNCGIDNADADHALADLCGKYCSAEDIMCYTKRKREKKGKKHENHQSIG